MPDRLTIACNLLDGAQALRLDADRYLGSRRMWRLSKAVDMERRAVELEIDEIVEESKAWHKNFNEETARMWAELERQQQAAAHSW